MATRSNKDKRLALKQATDEFLDADFDLEDNPNDPYLKKKKLDALQVLKAAQYNMERS
jgi:hypothetical protein